MTFARDLGMLGAFVVAVVLLFVVLYAYRSGGGRLELFGVLVENLTLSLASRSCAHAGAGVGR
jgi:hypothetical protein